MKMRNFKGSDIFATAKILKKHKVEKIWEEVKGIKDKIDKDTDIITLGIIGFTEMLSNKDTEKAMFEIIALAYEGKTPKEVSELDADILMEGLLDSNFFSFFKQAGRFMKLQS